MKKEIGAIDRFDWKTFIFSVQKQINSGEIKSPKFQICCLTFFLICFGIPLNGQIYYVKKDGTGNGKSWSHASGDLQKILSKAQFGTQIWVAEGTYFPTQTTDRTQTFNIPDGVRLFGGFAGHEKQLNERKPTFHLTILSGEIGTSVLKDNVFNVVTTRKVSAATVVDGFHISGGYALEKEKPQGHPHRSGAGWYNDGSTGYSNPTIRNCFFTKNTAMDGGAIYNNAQNGQSDLYISKCSFIQNTAYSDGGAIYYDSGNNHTGRTRFVRCFFSNNEGQNGAAIFNRNLKGKESLKIEDSSFLQNEALACGGAVFDYSNGKNSLSFQHCVFEKNTATLEGNDLYFFGKGKQKTKLSSSKNEETFKL